MAGDTAHLDKLLGLLAVSSSEPTESVDHPGSEKLFAYHANELSPEDDHRIREHLLVCQPCRDLLLDFDLFLQAPLEDGLEGAVDFAAAAEWRDLRKQISVEEDDAYAIPFERKTGWQFILSPLAAALIAGFIALPLLGILGWAIHLRGENRKLRHQVAELREPQANVFNQALKSTRGEAPKLPANSAIQLSFYTSTPRMYAEYPVVIVSAGGQTIWSDTLRKGRDGALTVALWPGFLEPGRYVIRLSGARNGRVETLEEYTVLVVTP